MSKPIDIEALADQIAGYGFAYLITVGEKNRIHTSAVHPSIAGLQLAVADPSERVRSNTLARPTVSLVWTPATSDGYSLIVDGEARTDADTLTVTPTRAVRHRPAPRADQNDDSVCGLDCIEI